MPEDPLHVVWVEPRFPGRLGAIADWFTRKRGYRSTFYCQNADSPEHWPSSVGRGLDLRAYVVGGAALESSVTWPRALERGLCHAFGFYEALERDKIRPIDVIVGRSMGIGSGLFASVHAPGVPVVQWFDGFLHAREHDLADEAPADMPEAYFRWRQSAGAMDLLDLENAQACFTPSEWQRSTYPVEYHDTLQVLHEGVDLRTFRPRSDRPKILKGNPLAPGTKLVTFVARSLDRLRGLDRFVAIAERIASARNDVVFALAGDPKVDRPLDVQWHNHVYLDALQLCHPRFDWSKFQVLGHLRSDELAELMAMSNLHLAPGRIYPLCRSTLQAMACGAPVLASDTPPHRAVFGNGVIPGADIDAWVAQSLAVLDDQEFAESINSTNRQTIASRFDRDRNLVQLACQFDRLVSGSEVFK